MKVEAAFIQMTEGRPQDAPVLQYMWTDNESLQYVVRSGKAAGEEIRFSSPSPGLTSEAKKEGEAACRGESRRPPARPTFPRSLDLFPLTSKRAAFYVRMRIRSRIHS